MLRCVVRTGSSRSLEARGPLLAIVVQAGAPATPQSDEAENFTATMLIDTGADCTMLDERVLGALGVAAVRKTLIGGISGRPEARLVYRMDLLVRMLDEAGALHEIVTRQDIVGMHLRPEREAGFGLLGRDYLVGMRFVYDGPRGAFALLTERAERG